MKYVHKPRLLYPTSEIEIENTAPTLKNCLGTLDETHIAMHVPAADRKPYRNRMGYLSRNALAACNFNIKFTYGLVGWERSAHDGRVLNDVI